ncbi:hypothetical protein [Endozoicomonas sp. ONNA1]|uniref:hypothetical protein n=1 Tax=Endozoicomonas sp. ONNA1 TaxID=2828740 RepID=UPI0021490F8C|nr:hypothetical protein [Endozoicomonas sp. ONNA1]
MLNPEGYELFVRTKVDLEKRLSDVDRTPVAREIEQQMSFVEERLLAKLKQVYSHATQEMSALDRILQHSLLDDDSET